MNWSLAIVRATSASYIFSTAQNAWFTTVMVESLPDSVATDEGYYHTDILDGNILRPSIVLTPADPTHPGIVTAGTQEFGGQKTFDSRVLLNSSIDSLSNTLDIGPDNADNINIGASSNTNVITIGNPNSTVIINGDTEYQNVTNLNVADKLITINDGGSATTGGNRDKFDHNVDRPGLVS